MSIPKTEDQDILHIHFDIDNAKTFKPGYNELGVPGAVTDQYNFDTVNGQLCKKAQRVVITLDQHPHDHRSLEAAHNPSKLETDMPGVSFKPMPMRDDATGKASAASGWVHGPDGKWTHPQATPNMSPVWKDHGKAGTENAKYDGDPQYVTDVIFKGTERNTEEFGAPGELLVDAMLSGFPDGKIPAGKKIAVTVGGLAENYCVENNAVNIVNELKKRGIPSDQVDIIIVEDATKGIYPPGVEGIQARQGFLDRMEKLGIKVLKSTSTEMSSIMGIPDRDPPINKPISVHGTVSRYEQVIKQEQAEIAKDITRTSLATKTLEMAGVDIGGKRSAVMAEMSKVTHLAERIEQIMHATTSQSIPSKGKPEHTNSSKVRIGK